MHTYARAYIRTYLHTYIHTYVHMLIAVHAYGTNMGHTHVFWCYTHAYIRADTCAYYASISSHAGRTLCVCLSLSLCICTQRTSHDVVQLAV